MHCSVLSVEKNGHYEGAEVDEVVEIKKNYKSMLDVLLIKTVKCRAEF